MSDLIARCLARLLSLLFPARGEHRAITLPEPEPAPPALTARRPLPTHKSPYAHAAAAQRPFIDTTRPVRPYVLAPTRHVQPTPEEEAQAERRWALDMADRGLDAGPSRIHGVHLLPDSRTIRVPIAA